MGELAVACGAEVSAVTACVATAEITCDGDGYAEISGCDVQDGALEACAICVPLSTDSACESCEKASCCDEMKAVVFDPDADAYQECLFACADQACQEACDETYSAMLAAMMAHVTCVDSNCGTVCE
jgi:hypothetical protein